ncbi:MAG: YiiX/YebB-like N1pC/P60 family cysteine hydrolase [Bacteroidia bacterium]
MKKLIFLFLVGLFFIPKILFSQSGAEVPAYDFSLFKEGDLLFQDIDCGPLCDAIEGVTQGHQGIDISHMGILVKKDDSLWVCEAIDKVVHLTSIPDFMKRTSNSDGDPKVIGARLIDGYSSLAKKAAKEAIKYLGTTYDSKFSDGDVSLYCSELVYYSFKNANGGKDFFKLEPMTFNSPETGKILEEWKKYFNELNIPVPEGMLGCNPAAYSKSDKLDIIYDSGDFIIKEKE